MTATGEMQNDNPFVRMSEAELDIATRKMTREVQRLNLDLADLTDRLQEIRGPFEARAEEARRNYDEVRAQIDAEMYAATSADSKRHGAARERLNDLGQQLAQATAEAERRTWTARLPNSGEEAALWLKNHPEAVGRFVDLTRENLSVTGGNIRVPGANVYTLHGRSGSARWNRHEHRVYLAFSQQSGQYLGYLVVEPSRHRGDTSAATGAVLGELYLRRGRVPDLDYDEGMKAFREVKPEEHVYGVHEPLKQFRLALSNPLYRAAPPTAIEDTA
jgi:hypothetical protein